MKDRNNEELKDLHAPSLQSTGRRAAKMAKVGSSEEWRQVFEKHTGRSRDETFLKSGS